MERVLAPTCRDPKSIRRYVHSAGTHFGGGFGSFWYILVSEFSTVDLG